MKLEVFESKHGTKVVTASNLHAALKLPTRQYGALVRRWLRDAYEFADGIRRPQPYRDFAKRPRPGEPIVGRPPDCIWRRRCPVPRRSCSSG